MLFESARGIFALFNNYTEDESKAINIREYNNVEKYESLKKGDIILANITIKNRYAYLNNASIKEVK